jgi:N-acetylmuramoyl-L-alanine amidase
MVLLKEVNMAHWTDLATWKGPTPNQGGSMYEQRGLVIHIAEGYLEGTLSWQKNPSAEVSSHFIVGGPRDGSSKDGVCYQVVDTGTIAWTQSAGNGHWLSIECSGFTPDKLSDKQMTKIAQVFAKCHTVYGVPLQIATNPNGRGLGHHSMGCNYGWGHCDCPGNNIINQKQEILNRAKAIVNGDDMATPEEIAAAVWNQNIASSGLGVTEKSAGNWLKYGYEITGKVSPASGLTPTGQDLVSLIANLSTKIDQLSTKMDGIIAGSVDPSVADALRAGADAIDPPATP